MSEGYCPLCGQPDRLRWSDTAGEKVCFGCRENMGEDDDGTAEKEPSE